MQFLLLFLTNLYFFGAFPAVRSIFFRLLAFCYRKKGVPLRSHSFYRTKKSRLRKKDINFHPGYFSSFIRHGGLLTQS